MSHGQEQGPYTRTVDTDLRASLKEIARQGQHGLNYVKDPCSLSHDIVPCVVATQHDVRVSKGEGSFSVNNPIIVQTWWKKTMRLWIRHLFRINVNV